MDEKTVKEEAKRIPYGMMNRRIVYGKALGCCLGIIE